jgi:hypothetical protein
MQGVLGRVGGCLGDPVLDAGPEPQRQRKRHKQLNVAVDPI